MSDLNTAWLMTAKVRIEGPIPNPSTVIELERGDFCGPVLIALTVENPYLPTLHVTARVVADDPLLATARFANAVQGVAEENDYVIADQDALNIGSKNIEIDILGETL